MRRIVAVAESSSGRWVAAAAESGWVTIWDREDRQRPEQVRFNRGPVDGPINDLRFSPDGKLLAIAGRDLAIFSTGKMEPLRVLRDDKANYGTVRFRADGESMVTVTGGAMIEEIATETGVVTQRICCSTIGGEVAYAPSGDGILSAGHWPTLWNPATGRPSLRYAGEREIETLRPIGFDGSGHVYMGSQDGRVYGWDVASGERLERSPAQTGYVDNLAVIRGHTPGAVWIAMARTGGQVNLWKPGSEGLRKLEGAAAFSTMAAGAEPGTLLLGNNRGSVEVWDIEAGRLLEYFSEPVARD